VPPATNLYLQTVVPSLPYEHLWEASVEEQIAQGIRLNPEAAIQIKIFEDGLVPVHNEIQVTVDGKTYTIQAAERLTDGYRRVYVWRPGYSVVGFDEDDF
jgi:hypothetical protein